MERKTQRGGWGTKPQNLADLKKRASLETASKEINETSGRVDQYQRTRASQQELRLTICFSVTTICYA
jgi:hypothetical protein